MVKKQQTIIALLMVGLTVLSISAKFQIVYAEDYTPDPYEPNDDNLHAKLLTEGVFTCTMGDDGLGNEDNLDWFKVALDQYDLVTISTECENVYADLDLYLYDTTVDYTLAYNWSSGSNATIRYMMPETGIYYIKVANYGMYDNITYYLTIDIGTLGSMPATEDWLSVKEEDSFKYQMTEKWQYGTEDEQGISLRITLEVAAIEVYDTFIAIKLAPKGISSDDDSALVYFFYDESKVFDSENGEMAISVYPIVPTAFQFPSDIYEIEGEEIPEEYQDFLVISEEGKKLELNFKDEELGNYSIIIEYSQEGVLQLMRMEIVSGEIGTSSYSYNFMEMEFVEPKDEEEEKNWWDSIDGYPAIYIVLFSGFAIVILKKFVSNRK